MAVFNDIEQYICTICREILLDPVTLPCNHTSCKDCLEQTLDNNKYQCFLCRKFIGSWYRNAKKRDLLINKELCNEIKKKFPDLIEKKLNGENINIDIPFDRIPQFSLPGEIKKEFELSLEKLKNELQIDREKEDKLSAEFIKQLEKEEIARKKQEELDEQLAKNLASELNSDLKTHQQDVEMQLQVDAELAKRLSENDREPQRTPMRDKLRKKQTRTKTSTVGPMDRFLELRKKNR